VIGAFFRQIDRADELGSGMCKMMLFGKAYGGSDPELIEGDIFRMVISVPEFGANPADVPQILSSTQSSGQVTGQVTGQVEDWIIQVLSVCLEPKKSAEIQAIIGIKHRETFQRNYLDRLLEEGLIVRTIPDKPQSRMQKYTITERGKMILENHTV